MKKKCLGMFINPECFRAHVVSNVCEKSTMCNECVGWLLNEVDPKHLCNGVACPHCGEPHNVKSGCFITTSKETVILLLLTVCLFKTCH